MSAPISFTVRPPSAPFRPSPLGQGSRGPPSRRLFEANHEEDEDDGSRRRERRPRDERVEGFRNGRTHGEEKTDGPLVIPSLPNRDWRQSSQRKVPSFRPEGKNGDGPIITHERIGDGPQLSGLRHAVKTEGGIADGGERVKVEQKVPNGLNSAKTTTAVEVKSEPLTLDQQALRELLAGEQRQETAEDRAQRDMVITMDAGAARLTMTEDDAFKRDIDELPEESNLEDYSAVPVSAFGLAMLRGMGWDPKSSANTTIHEPKQRPQLLGLGATPMDPTLRPTHNKQGSKRKQDHKTKSGRGFIANGLLLKKEREGSGSVTASGGSSRLPSPEGSEGKRRRDDAYDSDRSSKRRENGDGYRDKERQRDSDRNGDLERERYNGREYESEEERARRKAKERERERDRPSNGDHRKYDDRDRERPSDRRERDRDGGRDGYRDGYRDREDDRDTRRNGGSERDRERR